MNAAIVGANWQKKAPTAPANADVNYDGIVNIADAAIIGKNWQRHSWPQVHCSYLDPSSIIYGTGEGGATSALIHRQRAQEPTWRNLHFRISQKRSYSNFIK